jgi:hypothetical protein
MPQSTSLRRRIVRLIFFALVGCALVGLGRGRHRRQHDELVEEVAFEEPRQLTQIPTRRPKRRLVASLAFTVLFCAGGAFSALAGDQVAQLVEQNSEPAAIEAVEPQPGESPEAADSEALAEDPAAEAEALADAESELSESAETDPAESLEAAEESATDAEDAAPTLGWVRAQVPQSAARPAQEARPAAQRAWKRAARKPARKRHAARDARARETTAIDPEVNTPGMAATIWLHNALPDPTPPSLRLSKGFARNLRRSARAAGADWALVLAVLRAQGSRASAPARAPRVSQVSRRLAVLERGRETWSAVLAYTGRTAITDRAVALAHYYRAIGLSALVSGLEASKERMGRQVLTDPRVSIYGAGRYDIAYGRINVRVLALIAYLAESYGQVTVSSLVSGHRLYARKGVVSAHIYGHAVDITALGGFPIAGNQRPGGLTERAVRGILLLPAEMQPRQVISLLGLGGPSFPLANHADHIHVGY